MSNSKKLTAKQQRFVDEYLIDLNATQAAIRAGYSEKTARSQGQRLLTNVDIARVIKKAQSAISERNLVTQDDVIRGLLTEAEWMGEGSSHSARVQAWSQLGKHLGMFTDKVDHTSSDGSMSPKEKPDYSGLTDDELRQYIALESKVASTTSGIGKP